MRLSRVFFLLGFLGVPTAVVILFILVPAILTLIISFTGLDHRFRWEYVGLENYRKILIDPNIWIFVVNTAIFVVGTLVFNVGVGLFLALLSTHVAEPIGYLVRAVYLLPRVTPSVVFAFIMLWIFSPLDSGVLNSFLRNLGIEPIPWTTGYPWIFLFIVNGLVGCSLGMLIFTSAIKSIPQDYIVAARVDGASTLTIILRIVIPMIRGHIMFVTAYQTLSLITSFEYILLTLDGGPGYYTTEVWALAAFHRAFAQYALSSQYGYAAAMTAFLVASAAILTALYWRAFRIREMISQPKIEL
ncbi:MAG: sugar ABC transporter permease [Sulfolobales archaeon]